jgi:hypothetical protein
MGMHSVGVHEMGMHDVGMQDVGMQSVDVAAVSIYRAKPFYNKKCRFFSTISCWIVHADKTMATELKVENNPDNIFIQYNYSRETLPFIPNIGGFHRWLQL